MKGNSSDEESTKEIIGYKTQSVAEKKVVKEVTDTGKKK